MIAIEIWRNGSRLGLADTFDRIVSAKLTIHNENSPIILYMVGRNRRTGDHDSSAQVSAKLGDEITLKVVEMDDNSPIKITGQRLPGS